MNYDLNDPLLVDYVSFQVVLVAGSNGYFNYRHQGTKSQSQVAFLSLLSLMCMFQDKGFWISKKIFKLQHS